ncbi:hypothetical protein E5676_scaffold499G00460 [Cucumis melo var. makuwa]|uniref:Uncharacterized protein n=1 Tax=Cucumis melo var. makuwa TaxID=1194695 RepID=A0A5D3CGF9_CUCMM|nr:hypothetical protein E6C27_scaffold551G00160 [Cucumis melo var. makuwa]TYK09456.1 hypothetical protein E5676_scaffold499G00460 [Cucumis melo var. makuwa]
MLQTTQPNLNDDGGAFLATTVENQGINLIVAKLRVPPPNNDPSPVPTDLNSTVQHPIPPSHPTACDILSTSTCCPIRLRDMAFILLQHGLSIWSSAFIGWLALDAIGTSGGFLILWQALDFTVHDVIQGLYTISIHISMVDDFSFLLSTVYSPSDGFYLTDFWHELDNLAGLGGVSWIIGGNFNVTRWSSSGENT